MPNLSLLFIPGPPYPLEKIPGSAPAKLILTAGVDLEGGFKVDYKGQSAHALGAPPLDPQLNCSSYVICSIFHKLKEEGRWGRGGRRRGKGGGGGGGGGGERRGKGGGGEERGEGRGGGRRGKGGGEREGGRGVSRRGKGAGGDLEGGGARGRVRGGEG